MAESARFDVTRPAHECFDEVLRALRFPAAPHRELDEYADVPVLPAYERMP